MVISQFMPMMWIGSFGILATMLALHRNKESPDEEGEKNKHEVGKVAEGVCVVLLDKTLRTRKE